METNQPLHETKTTKQETLERSATVWETKMKPDKESPGGYHQWVLINEIAIPTGYSTESPHALTWMLRWQRLSDVQLGGSLLPRSEKLYSRHGFKVSLRDLPSKSYHAYSDTP